MGCSERRWWLHRFELSHVEPRHVELIGCYFLGKPKRIYGLSLFLSLLYTAAIYRAVFPHGQLFDKVHLERVQFCYFELAFSFATIFERNRLVLVLHLDVIHHEGLVLIG